VLILLTFLYLFLFCRAWKQKEAAPSASPPVNASAGAGASNPFGKFSFTKPSTSSAKPSSPFVPPPKPATSNPFGSTSLVAPKPATASTSAGGGAKDYKTQQDEIAAAFVENLKKWGIRKDLKTPMRQFVATQLSLEPEEEDPTPALATDSKPLFPAVDTSAPATVPFSFSTKPSPESPAPSFSFGGSTAAKPASSPAPAPAFSTGFSFNLAQPAAAAPAAPVPVPAVPTPAPAADAEGGEDGQEEAEEQVALESADVDWDGVFLCKARVYHHRDEGKPSRFASGEIKLQRHKINGTRRMVMRDVAGKVLMNMGIASGMSFQKSIMQGKARVNFFGLMDEDRGSEMFLLLCRTDDLDKLHSTLEELTKS
jgi:hypothetical protein